MDEINPREKDFVVFKVCGALIFHVLAIMGFFYSIWKGNWNSATFCLVLELFCTFVLLYCKYYIKGQLRAKHSARFFTVFKYVAIAAGVLNMCACIAYIVVGSMLKETFNETSHYAAAPVAFMAGFWSFVFAFDCIKYVRLLE